MNIDPILKAVSFAAIAHGTQLDKRGVPYMVHLTNVARAVAASTYSPVAAQAAILHDVLEDTGVTEAQLEREFGPQVTEIVRTLTRRNGDSYAEYIDNIVEAGGFAVSIKWADICDHLATIDEVPNSADLKRRYLRAMEVLEDER